MGNNLLNKILTIAIILMFFKISTMSDVADNIKNEDNILDSKLSSFSESIPDCWFYSEDHNGTANRDLEDIPWVNGYTGEVYVKDDTGTIVGFFEY